MTSKRRPYKKTYPKEFKLEAVRMMETSDRPASEIAAELGIHRNLLYKWEGRCKSQALLDDRALLACMAYVDLNPVRAKIAKTPETSKFTSIKKRIDLVKKGQSQRIALEPFVGIQEQHVGIPFKLGDYLELVDWTGRIVRSDKRGAISNKTPPILKRLAIQADAWTILTTQFEDQFNHWVGSEHIIRQVCSDKAYQRVPSTARHRHLLG